MTRLIGTLCTLTLAASLLGSASLIGHDARMARGHASELPQPGLMSRPDNLLGINVYLLGASPNEQAVALDNIQSAGFGWIRQVFDWSVLEPAPHTYDWADADALVDAASRRNLGLIAVLTNSPLWARPSSPDGTATGPPDDPQAFASFATAVAARYGGQLDFYQIWDEPNLQIGWGSRAPSASEYSRLLKAAYNAIHSVDPDAVLLLAGLAPTTEKGPHNISDILYMRQLYDAGAGPYFDVAAGKPYGFNSSHEDRTTDADVLNFSRFILLREEMERAGDADKLLWATNFGWYTAQTAIAPSAIWGNVTARSQRVYTLGAYRRAQLEWPWAGVLVLENYQPAGGPDDPRWGFALLSPKDDKSRLMMALRDSANSITYPAAPVGVHGADTPYAQYQGDWEFSDLGADIPQAGVAEITFTFIGTELGIIVRRANYRAYLYVEIDGEPANLLPRDMNGESYQVLTSPDLEPRVELLPLASSLSAGVHTAKLRAERGWDQWAIVGFSTVSAHNRTGFYLRLAGFVTLGLLSLVGVSFASRSMGGTFGASWLRNVLEGLSARTQTILTIGVAALFWLSAWMAWGHHLTHLLRRQGDTLPVAVTALSAGIFYYSPWLLLALVSIIALFFLFYVRPDIAIALIAFSAPFYLQPRPLFERVFSTVEVFTLVAAMAVGLHIVSDLKHRMPTVKWDLSCLTSLDLAVVAFILLSALSALNADVRGVAFTEFRVIVVEPVLLYMLLRVLPLSTKDVWRVVDFFVLGATFVAAIGLYQYAVGSNLIAAEGGVMRLRSVYGSPNNVGLYLGRALPVAVAVALLGSDPVRRRRYLIAGVAMAAALILSFSRGALLLGIPTAAAAIILVWRGKRVAGVLGVLAVLALLLVLALNVNPRFAEFFNLSTGPTFFRINLWRSTLSMIRDNPVTGVGLDNFLYAYRGGYISPLAWQEPNLSHAHNWALDYAARLGLLGLAVGIWLLASFFQMARRVYRRVSDTSLRALMVGLVASMLNFLSHGMVDASYWFVDLAFTFMLTAGLMARLGDMVQSESQTG